MRPIQSFNGSSPSSEPQQLLILNTNIPSYQSVPQQTLQSFQTLQNNLSSLQSLQSQLLLKQIQQSLQQTTSCSPSINTNTLNNNNNVQPFNTLQSLQGCIRNNNNIHNQSVSPINNLPQIPTQSTFNLNNLPINNNPNQFNASLNNISFLNNNNNNFVLFALNQLFNNNNNNNALISNCINPSMLCTNNNFNRKTNAPINNNNCNNGNRPTKICNVFGASPIKKEKTNNKFQSVNVNYKKINTISDKITFNNKSSIPPMVNITTNNSNFSPDSHDSVTDCNSVNTIITQPPKPRPPKPCNIYECEVCQKTFKYQSNLISHRRVHRVDCPKCHFCGKKFARKSNLIQHIRIHTNERPYKCNYCPKAFKQKHSLTDHIRSHTGERPFECNVCLKSFAVKHNLIVHKRIHSGEKPYLCKLCNTNYSSKSGINSHLKHRHPQLWAKRNKNKKIKSENTNTNTNKDYNIFNTNTNTNTNNDYYESPKQSDQLLNKLKLNIQSLTPLSPHQPNVNINMLSPPQVEIDPSDVYTQSIERLDVFPAFDIHKKNLKCLLYLVNQSNSLPALHLSLSGMDINKEARSTSITIWLKGERYDRTNV